jgi:hypothetical protein
MPVRGSKGAAVSVGWGISVGGDVVVPVTVGGTGVCVGVTGGAVGGCGVWVAGLENRVAVSVNGVFVGLRGRVEVGICPALVHPLIMNTRRTKKIGLLWHFMSSSLILHGNFDYIKFLTTLQFRHE